MLKWVGITLTTILLLPVILILSLYIPPVQRWCVQKATEIASQETGMDITIQSVSITPVLDINLGGLTAVQKGDTILNTAQIVIDLDFSNILHQSIGVESLKIQDGSINTCNMVDQLTLQGKLGLLQLQADNIDFGNQHVVLDGSLIDNCYLDISMRDTTIVDTTESEPIPWTVDVRQLSISNSNIQFHTAGDTLSVIAGIRTANLNGGDINLGDGAYQVSNIDICSDSILLCMKDSASSQHIRIPAMCLKLDSMMLDTTHISIRNITLSTENSGIEGSVHCDWNALTPYQRGRILLDVQGRLGHQDILSIAEDYIDGNLAGAYPQKPLDFHIIARGNVDDISIDSLHLNMNQVIDLRAAGNVCNAINGNPLGADVQWDVRTWNLDMVPKITGNNDLRIPAMTMTAQTRLDNDIYDADMVIRQDRGSIHATGHLDARNMDYTARVRISDLNIHNFLPHDSIYHLTATAKVSGHGTDPVSRATRINAQAGISQLRYGSWNLDNISATARLNRGNAQIDISSNNDLIWADACAEIDIDRKNTLAKFSADLSKIDFYALGMTPRPLTLSTVMQVDGTSNLKDTHAMTAQMKATQFITADSTFNTMDVLMNAYVDPDSIHAHAEAGDLLIDINSSDGIERLTRKINDFMAHLQKDVENHDVNRDVLRSLLPTVDAHISSGRKSPLNNILKSLGFSFQELKMDLVTNPIDGIEANGHINTLNTGAILLDTIQWNVFRNHEGLQMTSRIKNGPRNRIVNFESRINATLSDNGAKASLLFLDAQGRKGMDVGLELHIADSLATLHLTPLNPILAFRRFVVNPDNFISIDKDRRISANMNLLADDGTGLKLYSANNPFALQDLSLSVNHLNLGELSNALPFMPRVTGFLRGDIHMVKTTTDTTISSDLSVTNMTYDNAELGNVETNFVYFPNEDGSHYVDGILSQNGREVIFANGKYWSQYGVDMIDGSARLDNMAMNIVNGFIPQGLARLEGYASGELELKGQVQNPLLSGILMTDSLHICSDPYSINLRIPNDTVVIADSRIDLDRIEAYAASENPMTLDGIIDFSNLENIRLDLAMNAKNYKLIDARPNKKADAYGKVYVDMAATMRGSLSDLYIQGGLKVLGNTNVTYILRDSPLTVEDELAGLVEFVDFADTTYVEEISSNEQNIHMNIALSIDQAAEVHCFLSETGNNHVNLVGGGDLTLTYNNIDGMNLFGRYTILSGVMDYSLMVFSLKNFTIANGSYVEFHGNILNPTLSISASERIKSTVTTDKVPRSVTFDVGLDLSQTLENMGLEFTVNAPEDISIQNELAAMTPEQRGRVAVTMLATGMYISENSQSSGQGFSTSNALNSFLQGQINNIAGKALSTIDIGFDIGNTTNSLGATQTDYNFSFAKRFWNNRVSVVIGGKVSSGNSAVNNGQSIINNVSVEYRLDNSGTRYVKAYYDRNYESVLEGTVTEMGAGIVLRRKTERLGELFIFRNTKNKENSDKKQ